MHRQFAIYWDLENLQAACLERTAQRFQGYATQDVLLPILEAYQGFQQQGEVRIHKGYADWGRFHRYQKVAQEVRMQPQHVFRLSDAKNAADIQLVVDAVTDCLQHPGITDVVIASGDSDFTALTGRLRALGKRVHALAYLASASSHLQLAFDKCHDLAFAVRTPTTAARNRPASPETADAALAPSPPPTPMQAAPTRVAEALAVALAVSPERENVGVGSIANTVRILLPSFDPAAFGLPKNKWTLRVVDELIAASVVVAGTPGQSGPVVSVASRWQGLVDTALPSFPPDRLFEAWARGRRLFVTPTESTDLASLANTCSSDLGVDISVDAVAMALARVVPPSLETTDQPTSGAPNHPVPPDHPAPPPTIPSPMASAPTRVAEALAVALAVSPERQNVGVGSIANIVRILLPSFDPTAFGLPKNKWTLRVVDELIAASVFVAGTPVQSGLVVSEASGFRAFVDRVLPSFPADRLFEAWARGRRLFVTPTESTDLASLAITCSGDLGVDISVDAAAMALARVVPPSLETTAQPPTCH